MRVSDSLTPLPSSSRQQGGSAIVETVEIEALVDDSGNYTAAYYDSIASEVGGATPGRHLRARSFLHCRQSPLDKELAQAQYGWSPSKWLSERLKQIATGRSETTDPKTAQIEVGSSPQLSRTKKSAFNNPTRIMADGKSTHVEPRLLSLQKTSELLPLLPLPSTPLGG